MQPGAVSGSDYYVRLGLECDPFAAGALPDFFFVGAQRRYLVQRAVHALYFSGAMVVLLGADGAGKTHMLVEVEKELKDLADICSIEATVLMHAGEIRTLLAGALGLPGSVAAGNAEFVRALERVRPADGDPQPVLIAIDAAHLLSVDVLADCAALVGGAGGRLRLLLAGEADLAIAWQQAQAGAAEILELKPLSRDETEDYVRTRLQAAGYREAPALSEADYDQLFLQSGGNFAAINALTPQLLQPATQAAPVMSRLKALPILHIGVAAVLLAIVMLLVLYRGGDSQSPHDVGLPAVADNSAQQEPAAKSGVEQSTVALQLPIATASPTAPNPPASTLPPTSPPPADLAPPTPAAAQPETKAIKKEVAKTVATASQSKSSQRESVKAAKPSANTQTNAEASVLNAEERAVLAFPSSNYVLQVIAAASKATIDKFTDGAGKGMQLYCYRTQLRGKPWLVVVTGPYADKNAALAALAKLPPAVRKQQPWPRSVANVQADIRAHSGR
ncbi:MAG TPA: AAA family ATPase [Spongiibacteraceae bacterium]|nr:AAA family ATPase [Spongiibacteraceae bacterium]